MSRSRIENFDREFTALDSARRELALQTTDDLIHKLIENSERALASHSVGSSLIRSAAVVEQMINGITVRLWDDPFEWTLPESLPTTKDVIAYFEEVEAARLRGFEFLKDDSDLDRSIPAPVELKTLEAILGDTLVRSEEYLSKARMMLFAPEATG